jgi:hypothetical protein
MLFAVCGADADGWVKISLDDATRERMSEFLSSFTEVEMFEISNAVLEFGYSDFVYFGVMHNYMNEPELVKKIAGGKVAAQYDPTFRTIKKYFGVDADTGEMRIPATYKGIKFEYKNEAFVFDEPKPRKVWHTSVEEAYKEDWRILMKGFIYNRDDPSEERGSFWAYAQQPEGRRGSGEWTLLAIHEGEHDDQELDCIYRREYLTYDGLAAYDWRGTYSHGVR